MAYNVAWNEATPVGSSVNANTLDTELQELKESVRERMDDLLDSTTDWNNDAHEPKLLNLASALGGPDVGELIGTPSVARVYASGDQTIATASATDLEFDLETLDTGSYHDNVTNNERFTITDAGYYRIRGQILYTSGGSAGLVLLTIQKNGSNISNTSSNPASGEGETLAMEVIDLAAAADYYNLTLLQVSTGNRTVTGSPVSSFFEIEKINGTI